jgi:uncharacterized membrane protein
MRNTLGTILQLIPLLALPVLIPLQLGFGIPLVVMPFALLVGATLFVVGHWLRSR